MAIEEIHQTYIRETGDQYPEKPKRVWVSKLRGKATKAGFRWVLDCDKWQIRFLDWFQDQLEIGRKFSGPK